MGESLQEPAYRAFNDATLSSETSSAGYGSKALAVVAGLYFVFKLLEILGYPVWLWIHLAGERIRTLSITSRRSKTEELSLGDGTQSTEMQPGGKALNMFGLNPTSLLQKGVSGVAGALAKGSSTSPPGLGNWDNSCYQNSVIQGLASLSSLRDYLSETTTEYRSLDTETTNGALFDMIRKLNDPDNRGQHFWIRGKLKSMSTFTQQDAQEYYSKILDALDKEVQGASNSKRRSSASWLNAARSLSLPVNATGTEEKPIIEEEGKQMSPQQPRIVPNPLDGLLAQRVGCISCGYSEGLQLIPFNCITVSLGKGLQPYYIGECLDEYTHLEEIAGVECAKCTLLKNKATLARLADKNQEFKARLQAIEEALEDDDFDDKTLIKKFNIMKKNWVQSTKTRQAVIARAPKALVLHVNRSIFDEMTGAQYKNTAAVSYPRQLDLGNWCLGSRPSESHMPDNAAEEWPRDPKQSMLGDANAEPTTTSPFQYQLRAAVTHFGSHGNGHYICYRPHPFRPDFTSGIEESEKDSKPEQWWRFSDDNVYAISEEQAHQGNVFMLFYERIDESTLAPPDDVNATQATDAVLENLPLPPANIASLPAELVDDTAAEIALPEDSNDDLLPDLVSPEPATPPASTPDLPTLSTPPTAPPVPQPSEDAASAYPTPPPSTPPASQEEDFEPSEADSEDAPSTLLTSDDEATTPPPVPQLKSPGLRVMRTAGQSPGRGEGSRRSLPMVTAT